MDLFQHEGLVATLGGDLERLVCLLNRVLAHRTIRDSPKLDSAGGGDHDLALLHDLDRAGLLQERRCKRGEERLALAAANHEWRPSESGPDDTVGLIAADDEKREMPLKPWVETPHGLGKVAVVLILEHVDERLGVCVRGERVSRSGDLSAQVDVILKDAVHQDTKATVLREERVCVALLDDAVGRPPGVSHADGRGRRERVRHSSQSLHGTYGAGTLETGLADQHHASRVISSVFEMLEAGKDQFFAGPCPDVPDDPAHRAKRIRPARGPSE